MTDAQARALEWLPADGSWRSKPGRLMAAIDSLSLLRPRLVESESGSMGPRGGWISRYKLTQEGFKRRRAMMSDAP